MTISDANLPMIAVFDTDLAILNYLQSALSDRFKVNAFAEVTGLNRCLAEDTDVDLLLVDWHSAQECNEDGALGLLAEIRANKPSLSILLLACSVELRDVVLAARMGAVDLVLKPFRKSDIDSAIQRCLEESPLHRDSNDVNEIPLDKNTSFVRSCKRMREIESQCTLVARADIPVLILGESGTGKEVTAKLIHKMSTRSQQPFLKVNCAAMPADLLESELFGYEQGAFTGAVKAKPGKFELCNHGTILLDEIGEMPTILQAKLLQVLQDGSFSRLGGRSEVKVDVRVIAATNIDIQSAMAQKTFREDLYYRLNGFTVQMPPLRERKEEIPHMAEHFMRKARVKYSCNAMPITPRLLQALANHSWPGNLRELENVIRRYLVLANEQTIINELAALHSVGLSNPEEEITETDGGLKCLVRSLKGDAEASVIARKLEDTQWNRKAAANELQISYKALLYKIKQYNLTPPPKQSSFTSATLQYNFNKRSQLVEQVQ